MKRIKFTQQQIIEFFGVALGIALLFGFYILLKFGLKVGIIVLLQDFSIPYWAVIILSLLLGYFFIKGVRFAAKPALKALDRWLEDQDTKKEDET